jgi:hypothetical protein
VNAEGDVNRGEDDRGNDQGNEKDFRIDLFHARGPVLDLQSVLLRLDCNPCSRGEKSDNVLKMNRKTRTPAFLPFEKVETDFPFLLL